MKNTTSLLRLCSALILILGGFISCTLPDPQTPNPTAVSFSSLTANGASGAVTTTQLTLAFDVDPTSLAAADITVTGAAKGTLSGSGTTRTLTISSITVGNGADVTVDLANPAGFDISPASRTVAVYVAPTAVSFTSLTANGASGAVTTTQLTLTFDVDPTSLAAADITVTGADKGTLSGSGLARILALSSITVANGEDVTVSIDNPAGFVINPSSRTVAVNKAPVIVPVISVGIAPSTAAVFVNGTVQLSAVFNPTDATNKGVSWSSNTGRATVDQSGLVTGVFPGTATITVTTSDGGKTGTCDVMVDFDGDFISAGETIASTTVGKSNVLVTYEGSSNAFIGPEKVFAFPASSNSMVQVTLSGLAKNLDLIVLEGILDGNSCIYISEQASTLNEQIMFMAIAGSNYYFVVDSVDPSYACPFSIRVDVF